MMMSSTCTRLLRVHIANNILHRVPIKRATTRRRRRRPLPGGGWPYGDVCCQAPIAKQRQYQQCAFFSSIPSSSATGRTTLQQQQQHQTTKERQIHHQDLSNNNDDDDEICDKEELDDEEEDITKEERKDWSLQEISNIDRWDHPQMSQIIDDIAYRLKYQLELLKELSQILVKTRKGPILLSSMPSTSGSSSPITSNGMMLRPYWWTIKQESQLIQEIDKQQREIQNLQRLYNDTYKQIQQYQSLTNSNNNINNTQQKNKNHRQHLLFKLFGEIYSRHALTIETFAEIVISLKQIQQPKSFNTIINELLLQERLGMLLLCDHITQICKIKKSSSSSSSSPISKNEDIVDIVSKAVTEAKHLCEVHYLTSPNIHVIQNNNATTTEEEAPLSSNNGDDNDDDFFIVKPWLQYTLVELLKNSMSVTIERNRTTSSSSSLHAEEKSKEDDHSSEQEEDHEVLYYPIYINVEETQTMIRINIHDQGGGISGPKRKKVFEFAQHIKKWDRMDDQQTYAMTRSPLQGLGVGLSMSKMMMEYFGGTLSLEDRRHDQDHHDHDDRDYDYGIPSLVMTNNEEPTTTTTTEKSLLERGVTATIVLPKDTTIVEKKRNRPTSTTTFLLHL